MATLIKTLSLSLVERNGEVRSFHVPGVSAKTLKPYLKYHIDPEAHLMTDDAGQYKIIGPEFAEHDVVCHSQDEYVRGEVHTNTVEGFFSILKRGLIGIYQHVSVQHYNVMLPSLISDITIVLNLDTMIPARHRRPQGYCR